MDCMEEHGVSSDYSLYSTNVKSGHKLIRVNHITTYELLRGEIQTGIH